MCSRSCRQENAALLSLRRHGEHGLSNGVDRRTLEDPHDGPGDNFTNVLCEAFTLVDPKAVKTYS